jgi:hypothetical protein
VSTVPFDVLRAIVAARQAASPTCRLLAAKNARGLAPSGTRQLIDLFARGQGFGAGTGHFASGSPVSGQDEQHV